MRLRLARWGFSPHALSDKLVTNRTRICARTCRYLPNGGKSDTLVITF